ncbi:preprotein translocase subunit YajC [Frankia sp. AiPs1]|uniref:preprotein translocase subunit YajC n=1 Tax=Frankia sp. AiPs1 TaxID=573493 RepID=UPI0020439ADA|nr:preprotein translocase subunit YajC [Frankia sp. AiPs1]MCM3925887.1 preprotein translocase subunit YajC [Frankia sp. AiPs1]
MRGLVTAATAADGNGGSSIGGFLIPLLLVLAVVYIFSMQRRRTKAQQQQVSQILPGTLVVTTAGLYATVVELVDGDVLLEIAPDVVCRFTRSAIARVISSPDTDEEHDDGSADGDAHDGPVDPATSADHPPAPGAGSAVGEADAEGPAATDGSESEGKGVPRPPRKEL